MRSLHPALSRVSGLLLLAVGAAAAGAAGDPYEAIRKVMSPDRKVRRAGARELRKENRPEYLAALVDAYFFTPRSHREELQKVLQDLSGERFERYSEWVEYVGGRTDVEPAAGYLDWKRSLLVRIDVGYRQILPPEVPTRIRLEEIVWGGVPIAGIPALDEPPVLAAEQAGYLEEEERVFGVLLGGEARAYPLRILDWHEMLNDTVGGLPVSLSYCTLCGSGILYSTRMSSGGRYTFDTSGLLYRSNKLMVERDSRSLWSNLTGRPVVGELARTEIRLEMLPMTLTTWREWRRRHPRTTVLDLDGIRADLAGRFNFDYRPGAAVLARSGVSFPVWRKSGLLDRDERIFALRVAGRPKAYPLTTLYRLQVINDQVGGTAIVLVADAESGSVRAYRSEQLAFEGGSTSGVLVDGEGRDWRVEEAALVPVSEGLESLPRIAGHVALWFGWYGFYPQTEVYGETE